MPQNLRWPFKSQPYTSVVSTLAANSAALVILRPALFAGRRTYALCVLQITLDRDPDNPSKYNLCEVIVSSFLSPTCS